jgi:hypothetical protein
MKRVFLIFVIVFLFLVGLSANGFAYSFSDLYQETYWEPADGYDYGTTDLGAGLGTYKGTGVLPNYGDQTVLNFFKNSGFTGVNEVPLTLTGQNSYAGTWTSGNPTPSNFVDFIMVKGSTSFSIHLYDPAATSGIWNVGYLANAGNGNSGKPPGMSFVRGYSTSKPVPEPVTMLLLGFGLVGMAGVRWKLLKN